MRFIIFRNVFIAFCALCMAWETLRLAGAPIKADAFSLFIFFCTFFIYNFHSFANNLVRHPFEKFFHLLDKDVSLEQRICVVAGFIGSVISLFYVSFRTLAFCFIFGLITIAYTIPIFNVKGKRTRLREVSYIKILTVSLMWTLITVVLPLTENNHAISYELFSLIFIERVLFIYSITIPFEIRDMEQEKRIGVRTIPAIHGIENSKRLGYTLITLFAVLSAVHQYYYSNHLNIALPFILSAILVTMLIYYTREKNSRWYFKGFIDGTMIVQYYLLVIFNLAAF